MSMNMTTSTDYTNELSMVLNNEEYNMHAWYEIQTIKNNCYNKQFESNYRRYMPIIYNF